MEVWQGVWQGVCGKGRCGKGRGVASGGVARGPYAHSIPQIARKVVSIGSKVTKQAIKYAPVDDRVKKGVGAGADLVKDQAEADPHAGIGQRVAMGVGKCPL